MSVFAEGLLGEWQAARYLRKQGIKILRTRYRGTHGEIDLIARDGDTLCFVEVKARPAGHLGDGIAAVNTVKRRRIRSAAQQYLAEHPAFNVRYDVVEITAAGIRYLKNAF